MNELYKEVLVPTCLYSAIKKRVLYQNFLVIVLASKYALHFLINVECRSGPIRIYLHGAFYFTFTFVFFKENSTVKSLINKTLDFSI